MTHLVAFLAGCVFATLAILLWLGRDELRRAPRILRDEPDEHLRPWVARVRRWVRWVLRRGRRSP